MVWACHLCNKKQELLAKTGAWYHGGMARPVALEVGENAATGAAPGSRPPGRGGMEASPPNEKKAKMGGAGDAASGSEKENYDRQRSFPRASSLQGRELKRQYSMSDAVSSQRGHDGASQASSGQTPEAAVEGEKGQERGRGRERTSAKHRFHSESRLSETDKRCAAMQHPESRHRDRGGDPTERLDRERGDRERERGERSDRERGERHQASRLRDPSAEPSAGVHRTEERRAEKEARHRCVAVCCVCYRCVAVCCVCYRCVFCVLQVCGCVCCVLQVCVCVLQVRGCVFCVLQVWLCVLCVTGACLCVTGAWLCVIGVWLCVCV